MSTDELERINDLSQRVINQIATNSELVEYKRLLQRWNDAFENTNRNYQSEPNVKID